MKPPALHPSLAFHITNSLGWTSLRPLQQLALGPILEGRHALLIAPTAGGKTEAAVLPLLSRMLSDSWSGLSVLYVCPLRALLNNLEPRLARYAGLVGRRVGLWHGDVPSRAKNAIRRLPPDLLLTTPESLEGLLCSRRIDAQGFFGSIRAVVIDEIHAFAGDDRGWHLASVLERISHLAGRELQRVGLSATVGNPEQLLEWMAGHCSGGRVVVRDPGPAGSRSMASPPEVQLDWVGTLANAATVIAELHRGEKRLVFCDSRARAEELAHALIERGVTTYVSHSSLSREVRAFSERAFTESRNCVIVATSTLELGIDIGDLDRVIQIDAPTTVAGFLQRLGRTGRREHTRSNCLFLATHAQAFLRAAGLLRLWHEGYVEPVVPPPEPFHVLAQQLMALCLQTGGVAPDQWREWVLRMPGFSGLDADDVERLEGFLLETEVLRSDQGLLWFGAEGEARYRHRNFLELMSLITDAPLFTVYCGKLEIGEVDRSSFDLQRDQPPVLLLGGRSWQVEHIDWKKKRCWVSPVELAGRSRWLGEGQALGFVLCQSIRQVLSADDSPPWLTRRAQLLLPELREQFPWLHDAGPSVLERRNDAETRWWTFAGLRANATIVAVLEHSLGTPPGQSVPFDNFSITLAPSTAEFVRQSCPLAIPDDIGVSLHARALEALKFGEALPPELVAKVVAARWSDVDGARVVLGSRPAVAAGKKTTGSA